MKVNNFHKSIFIDGKESIKNQKGITGDFSKKRDNVVELRGAMNADNDTSVSEALEINKLVKKLGKIAASEPQEENISLKEINDLRAELKNLTSDSLADKFIKGN